MKEYPSINFWNKGTYGESVWVFEKLDGSSIRAEWNRKQGWYKFGSKKVMIDERDYHLGEAVTLFKKKYGESLPKIFRDDKEIRNRDNVTVFYEYFGPLTFAGLHTNIDQKDVVLFDVSPHKMGMLTPKEFIQKFESVDTAIYLGKHNFNKDLIRRVFEGDQLGLTLRQNTYEGVVCKGVVKTKGREKIWMVKLKTKDWLTKLKNRSGYAEFIKELNNDPELIHILDEQ